jgi:hypothetical protein
MGTSGAAPSETVSASDEVIDAIADIERQRRETEKQAGFAMSCSSALHRLNELHDHETEALRLRGPDSGHQANVQAVTIEIGRLKGLSAGKVPNSNRFPGSARNGQGQRSWHDAPRSPARNKGRRTMGRAGGR